jgi:trehalose/maltose hydrolase-like predicted phosphorylase/hydroxymethylpyrimidine pyrophosphatase-like HAD family hydrolase
MAQSKDSRGRLAASDQQGRVGGLLWCSAFRLVVFDWDGTAVTDRQEDARPLREAMLAAADKGVTFVIVTGTSITNVARQLAFAEHPPAAGQVYALTNRGSEAFAFDERGQPTLLWRRESTTDESRRLDAIAAGVKAALETRTHQRIDVIANRLNRRKIDLIPEPAWANPPKARLGELLAAVNDRFRAAGVVDGLDLALGIARQQAIAEGLPHAHISSDAKHVEVGLTNKGDAMAWVLEHLAPALGVTLQEILVAGDEFGPLGSAGGSDAEMSLPQAIGASFVSVGVEPAGLPAGVLPMPGGPATFLRLLHEIAERPQAASLPALYLPTLEAGWTLVADGYDADHQPELEARFAIGNGYLGSRGALSQDPPTAHAGTYVAGIFNADAGGHAELVTAPDWRHTSIEIDGEALDLLRGDILLHRIVLDMRRGMFLRIWRHRHGDGRVTRVHEARWVSLADVHGLFQATWIVPENYTGGMILTTMLDGRVLNTLGASQLIAPPLSSTQGPTLLMRTSDAAYKMALSTVATVTNQAIGPTTLAAPEQVTQTWSAQARPERPLELRRAVAIFTTRDVDAPAVAARTHADELGAGTFESHAVAHIAAWQERWQAADVEIDGDPQAQQAIRFAIYHLIAAANASDERVSIGARGLTGDGYAGHVFWDTEIYMLPFYLHTWPSAARALLMYRFHTLDAARDRAKAHGYSGAMFAWESADSGRDETPAVGIGPNAEKVPILTGLLEQHVVADIGWAVWRYWLATGDAAFMRDAGAEMLIEIARFWRSRVTLDAEGCFHILDVIGPDEYHEHVNDDAFTNHLVRWVMQRAVEAVALVRSKYPADWDQLAVSLGFQATECETWQAVAAAIATLQDPATGLIEQFQGYFGLEEIDLTAYPNRQVSMGLLLEPAQLQRSKLIKQGDVVALLHLFGAELPSSVVGTNYHYYAPRTAHDSSICRSAYGLVAARLGLLDEALRFFWSAAAVDLTNDMGNGGLGVHMAALGGLWQLIAYGFLGLTSYDDHVALNPALPKLWTRLAMPFRHAEWCLRVTVTQDDLEVTLEGQGALQVVLGEAGARLLTPGCHQAHRNELEGNWQWTDKP